MGQVFFVSWALWEKMCFVLAGAIVLTILAGCVKLTWSRWKLRKYLAIAGTSGEPVSTMESGQNMTQANVAEVPFGVRAIESGIVVEGVWVSRSNYPFVESPVLGSWSTPNSSSDPGSGEDRTSLGVQRSPVTAHQPVGGASDRVQNIGLGEATQMGQAQTSNEKGKVRQGDDTWGAIGASESSLTKDSENLSPAVKEANLESLYNHRMSHVAEVGQLVPRVRQPNGNGEASEIKASQGGTSRGQGDYDDIAPSRDFPQDVEKALASPSRASDVADVSMRSLSVQASQGRQSPSAIANKSGMSLDERHPVRAEMPGPLHGGDVNTHLHRNKVVRKVNSGFEILPAGTFGNVEDCDRTNGSNNRAGIFAGPKDGRKKLGKLQKQRKQQKQPGSSSSKGRTSPSIESA